MNNDLKNVDAAVLASKKKVIQPRPEPVSQLLPPFQVVPKSDKNEENSEAPPPPETHTLVNTADGRTLLVPKSVTEKLPAEVQKVLEQFPYSASVFTVIANWCEKLGADGVAPSPKPIPNAYTDFHLLCNDFEKELFEKYLFFKEDGATLLGTTNAAEQYKMEGLLTFCIVAIGCCARGTSEHQILALFDQLNDVTEEERENAKKKYTWLEGAMKAHN